MEEQADGGDRLEGEMWSHPGFPLSLNMGTRSTHAFTQRTWDLLSTLTSPHSWITLLLVHTKLVPTSGPLHLLLTLPRCLLRSPCGQPFLLSVS